MIGTPAQNLDRQHDVIPAPELVSHITHVALAFMPASVFNEEAPSSWPLFTTPSAVRGEFSTGVSIMVAIGGWGDTNTFTKAAATLGSRRRFATNVKAMVDQLGADGEDPQWPLTS